MKTRYWWAALGGLCLVLSFGWWLAARAVREQAFADGGAPAGRGRGAAEATPLRGMQPSVAQPPAVADFVPAAAADPIAAFNEWAQRYLAAGPGARAAMASEGLALAQARRGPFKELIRTDPQMALQGAVSMVVRQQLPPGILALLETRVNGVAVLRVLQAVPMPGEPLPAGSLTFREAEFEGGKTYRAYVYGRRAEQVTWTPGASLNGVALDADFAVNSDPSRTLEIGEIPAPGKPVVSICPISGETTPGAVLETGQAITAETPAVETATEIVHFCGPIHINLFNETLIMGEGVSGGAFGFTGILPAAPTPALGTVKVLAIPMTYADQNAVPATEATLYSTLRDVGDFYAKASFGRLTLVSVVTPPVKLPHNEAWYVNRDTSNGGDISGTSVEHNHAREEARKLGFDSNDYDCIVVRHNGGPGSYGGLGGGSSVWARSDSASLWAHEIGHCFALAHSNFWDTAGTSSIGAGTNQEYGDTYDNMGSGPFPAAHYNSQAKSQVKWLPPNFVRTVLQSGQYRIYAFDQGGLLPDRDYALTIVKDAQKTYWGEVRSLFDTNPWVKNGLLLGWRYPNGSGSNLQRIDTTPGSPFLKEDAPISVGTTFSDTEAGIHLTTVAVNDSPRYVDVIVNLGQFAGNQKPTLSLAASAEVVPTNAMVTFTAAANDPDGDALAYSWQHFGDTNVKLVSGNTPVITRTFGTAGTYIVACTVSDMKGGSATRYQLITVGNGNSRYTISGRVTLLGQGLQDVVVTANNANGVVTDADGYFTIANLTANTYTLTPLLYGFAFSELFNNSITVGPNAEGAEFEATPSPVVTIAATIPDAAELVPVTAGRFTLTRTGDLSQELVVNVNTVQGSATKTTDYTFSPDYAAGSQGFSTFTVPAESATLHVMVTPVSDALQEGPETVILQLGPGNGYLVGPESGATVVINDDDTALAKVSVAATTVSTIEGSGEPAAITFTRTGATTNPLTITYNVGGTATDGIDFPALTGSVLIAAGALSTAVEVPALNDSVSEPLETVRLTLSSNAAYLINPLATSATVNLIDDDLQTVTVAATDSATQEVDLTAEGAVANTGTFVVARSGDTANPLTVYYSLSGTPATGVPALHGVDFEALPGVLMIPAGATQAAVTIIPRHDTLGEGSESVVLSLGAGSTHYVLGSPSSATVTITDAPGDIPYLDVVNTSSASEPSTNGIFRLTRRSSDTGALTVSYTIGGTATNGTDYDSGLVWAAQTSGTASTLNGVWGSSTTSVWAVGDGGTILNWNGSAWSPQTSGTANALRGVWGTSTTSVWAVGDGGTILKWNGSAWSAQISGTANALRGIWGSDASNVWAVGDSGTILKWNGTAWSAQTSGTTNALYGVWGNASTSLWAVGASGVVRKWNGTSWGTQTSGTTATLRSVWGTSATSVWATGTSGTIMRFNGTSWLAQPSNTGVDLTAIWGADASNLWTSGDNGTLLRTTNGGSAWVTQTSSTAVPLNSLRGIDANNVWAVGDTGTVVNWNTTASLPLTGTLVIPAGTNSVDATIRPINDAAAEELESISFSITPNANYQTYAQTSEATMWLRDDDQPTVYVDTQVGTSGSSTITEGGSGVVKFYVSRTGSTASALTVNYTIGGTATPGSDFTALSGSVTIPAGSVGADVPVVIANDSLFEGTETIAFTFAPGSYARSPAGALMYVADNDTATQTVDFASTGATGMESGGTVNIPVSLATPAAAPVTVEFAVDSGPRTAATTSANTQILPYWVRVVRNSSSFTFFYSNDGVVWVQRGGTITNAMSSTSYLAGLAVASSTSGVSCTATLDNLSVTNLAAGGSAGSMVHADVGSVTPAGSSSVDSGVYTVTAGGPDISASSTTDAFRYVYFPVSNSTTCTITARVVAIAGGNATSKAGVMIREGTANNARHGSMLAAQSGTNYYIYRTSTGSNAANSSSTTMIRPVWLRLQRAGHVFSAFRSPDGATWSQVGSNQTIVLPPDVLGGLTVSAKSDGSLSTATFDQVMVSPAASEPLQGRTVGFVNEQGSDSVTGAVHTVIGSGAGINVNTQDECHFTAAAVTGDFVLTARLLTQAGGATNAQAGVMIRENGNFRGRMLYLGGIANSGVEFISRATSVTNTLGSGVDYTLDAGILNFSIGEQTKNIALAITNDSMAEPDEVITVMLRNAFGANVGTNNPFTYTILDDDAPSVNPHAGFAAATSSAAESAGMASVLVSLSAPAASAVSVDYAATGGTADNGTDYVLAAGTLTFAAGESVKAFTVGITDDSAIEGNEMVLVALSTPVGVQLGSLSTHTFTITDDDLPVVTVVATDASAAEAGLDQGEFTFYRTGSTADSLTVNYTVGGTATSGSDRQGVGTSVTFDSGSNISQRFVIPIDDSANEGSETTILTIGANAGYTVGTPSAATVTIADDDRSTVWIEANDADASETAGNPGQFVVKRSEPLTPSLTVNLTISGTAANSTDYATVTTSVVFNPEEASKAIDILPLNDAVTEGAEQVTISIANGSYTIGASAYDNVTIDDNDSPPTLFISHPTAQGPLIANGNGVIVSATVTDDGAPQPVSLTWSQASGPGVATIESPASATTAITFSDPGTYVVRITADDGQFTVSDQATVVVGSSIAAADWITQDLGPSSARRGQGLQYGTLFTVIGTGSGYGGTNDAAHVMVRAVDGDTSITARITSLQGTGAPLSGVTIRDAMARGARRAVLGYVPGTGLQFRTRTTAGAADSVVTQNGIALPVWLKLERDAATHEVTASYAPDSSGAPGAWTIIGSPTVVMMDARADVGLTTTSNTAASTATAVIDNVVLTPVPSGPAFLAEDAGASPAAAGSGSVAGTTYTVAGSTSGYYYGWQYCGDLVITTRLVNSTSGAGSAKCGIRIAESMEAGAYAHMGRIPTGAYSGYVWTSIAGGSGGGLPSGVANGNWIRILRRGNSITAFRAADVSGNPGTWAQIGQPQTVIMTTPVFVGFWVDNASGVGLNTVTFNNLSIVPLNKAPIVEAGSVPAGVLTPVSLDAMVTDDNYPAPPALATLWSASNGPGAVVFGNASEIDTTAAFSADGSYTLRLSANDGSVQAFDDVSFTGYRNAFARWQAGQFPGGSANPMAALDADPDGDRLINLFEFGFGLTGNVADVDPAVYEMTLSGEDRFFRVTIPKNPDATDLVFQVEATSDLLDPLSWSSTGLVIEANTATLMRVRDNVPATPGQRRFMRVRVTLPP